MPFAALQAHAALRTQGSTYVRQDQSLQRINTWPLGGLTSLSSVGKPGICRAYSAAARNSRVRCMSAPPPAMPPPGSEAPGALPPRSLSLGTMWCGPVACVAVTIIITMNACPCRIRKVLLRLIRSWDFSCKKEEPLRYLK